MIAQLAKCPGCAAVVGVVFQLQPSGLTEDDRKLVDWWQARGLRISGTYVTEASYTLGECTCTQDLA